MRLMPRPVLHYLRCGDFMDTKKLLLFIFSILLIFSLPLLCAANVPLMPVEDIRPGMQGIGKTVINGENIENFNVEVIGVTGSEAGGYSILVRTSGDVIEKSGGVAQGMSGSPVYINGRLVGAVAFGKEFNDPHYCFLTPIGRMLDLLDETSPRPSELVPKSTMLMAGGFTPKGLDYLNSKLAPLGLEATGAGGSGGFNSDKPIEPGSAIGVSLIRGDIRLGALGTVTWVGDDGSLLAFGHPFMQRGDSNYFLERAWILASLPNLQSAYKVGNLGATIGTVTQDRGAGIAAQIGAPPKVIPMYVSVTDSSRGVNGSARTELIDDDALLPSMVDAVTYNTVTRVADREGGGTARFNFRIDGRSAGGEQIKIQRENMYYADAGILKMISQELVQAATLLAQNKFEKIDVYNIEANVVLGTEPEVAEIISARPQKLNVRAGEELAIDVELQPYRAEKFTRTVKFTVPKQQRPGKMALNVRGGSSLAWMQELMKRQQEEGIPAAKKPQRRTLKDFIADINNADQNNEIIVDIAALPDPDMAAQQQDTGFAAALAGTPAKQKTTMNFIVDGTADIMVEITG